MSTRKSWLLRLIFSVLFAIISASAYAGHALISLPPESEVTVKVRVVQRIEMLTAPNQATYFLIEESASPMIAFRAFASSGTVPQELLGLPCTAKVKIHERSKEYREYEILEVKGPPPQGVAK